MERQRGRCTVLAAWGLALACAGAADEPTPDAGRRAAATPESPSRIVSLVPAATEILFALDAGDRLVGRTRWGVHPAAARAVPDVGDGMRPSLEAVLERDPDLVLLYRGAANAGVAERLAALGIPTLELQHDTFRDLERNIDTLGRVVACPEGARRLGAWIEEGLADVAAAVADRPPVRVYYDAWGEPPITIGRGSFLDSLLSIAGAANVFGDRPESGPRVGLEAIVDRDPDRILTTAAEDSLGFDPRLADRPGWDGIGAVREGRVAVVDRDLVGRLGPRVADAARAVARALHPGATLPPPAAWEPTCG